MVKIKLQEEIGFKEFEELVEDLPSDELIDDLQEKDDTAVVASDAELDEADAEVDESEEESDGPKKETRTLYVTNKDLLAEIHKSKMSFCEIVDNRFFHYDAILNSLDEITNEVIDEAKAKRAKRLTLALKASLKESGAKPLAIKEAAVTVDMISLDELCFRVMCVDHVPLDPTRKRRGKGINAQHVKTQFLPFKHWAYQNGVLTEMARSHWRGDFTTGSFDLHRGQITKNLAKMFMMLVDRYSRRSNWRSYTYLDEMKGHALLQLSQIGLQFNEAVGDNPFAFYTTSAKNCFTRMLNLEKKNQNIRDDILIMCGSTPSFTRQNDEEHARAMKKELARMGITAEKPEEEIIEEVEETTEAPEIIPEEIEPKKKAKKEQLSSTFDDIIVHQN